MIKLDPFKILFAFTTGVATFFSPCSYALLPAYLVYYFKTEESGLKKCILNSLLMSSGILTIFGTLFLITSIISEYIKAIQLASSTFTGLTLILIGFLSLKAPSS